MLWPLGSRRLRELRRGHPRAPDEGLDASPATPPDSEVLDGSVAAPPTITIKTYTRSSTAALGNLTSATWAAFQDATGTWKVLLPTSAGTYSFTTAGPKWGAIFVCAKDATGSFVDVFYRTTATTSLDVPLSDDGST